MQILRNEWKYFIGSGVDVLGWWINAWFRSNDIRQARNHCFQSIFTFPNIKYINQILCSFSIKYIWFFFSKILSLCLYNNRKSFDIQIFCEWYCIMIKLFILHIKNKNNTISMVWSMEGKLGKCSNSFYYIS